MLRYIPVLQKNIYITHYSSVCTCILYWIFGVWRYTAQVHVQASIAHQAANLYCSSSECSAYIHIISAAIQFVCLEYLQHLYFLVMIMPLMTCWLNLVMNVWTWQCHRRWYVSLQNKEIRLKATTEILLEWKEMHHISWFVFAYSEFHLVLLLFSVFLLLSKMIGMTKISKASSYGKTAITPTETKDSSSATEKTE